MVYQDFSNMFDLWSKYADYQFHESPSLTGSVISELESPKKRNFVHFYQTLLFKHCHLLV